MTDNHNDDGQGKQTPGITPAKGGDEDKKKGMTVDSFGWTGRRDEDAAPAAGDDAGKDKLDPEIEFDTKDMASYPGEQATAGDDAEAVPAAAAKAEDDTSNPNSGKRDWDHLSKEVPLELREDGVENLRATLSTADDPTGRALLGKIFAKAQVKAAEIAAAYQTVKARHAEYESRAKGARLARIGTLGAEMALLSPWNWALAIGMLGLGGVTAVTLGPVAFFVCAAGLTALFSARTIITYYMQKWALGYLEDGKKGIGLAYGAAALVLTLLHAAGVGAKMMGPDAIINGTDWNPMEGGKTEYKSAFGDPAEIQAKIKEITAQEVAVRQAAGGGTDTTTLTTRMEALDAQEAAIRAEAAKPAGNKDEFLQRIQVLGQEESQAQAKLADGSPDNDREARRTLQRIAEERQSLNRKLDLADQPRGLTAVDQDNLRRISQEKDSLSEQLKEAVKPKDLDAKAQESLDKLARQKDVLVKQLEQAGKQTSTNIDTSDWNDTQKNSVTSLSLIQGGAGLVFAAGNYVAAGAEHRNEKLRGIINGIPDSNQKAAANGNAPQSGQVISLKRHFMGFDVDAFRSGMHNTNNHRMDYEHLTKVASVASEPYAWQNELIELANDELHRERIALMQNFDRGLISADERDTKMKAVQTAHGAALDQLSSDEGLERIVLTFGKYMQDSKTLLGQIEARKAKGAGAAPAL